MGEKDYINIINLSKSFGNVKALDNINLSINNGELLTILGPSGCGKTTLFKIIAGLEKPDTGDIFIDGFRINDVPPYKRNIGMVFQDLALFPHLNVIENIAFGLKIKKLQENEIKEKVSKILELVKLPIEEYGNRKVTQLSGGQQQRVALARALVLEPKVLLLDEPFSHLDYKIRQELMVELKRIQRSLNITTIYVTHDQTEAMFMSDRVAIMHNGKVFQVGKPSEVYDNPINTFVATFFGEVNIIEGKLNNGFIIVDGCKPIKLRNIKINNNGSDHVHIILRPEKVKIGNANKNNYIAKGKIEDMIFLGPFVKIDIKINDKQYLKALTPRDICKEINIGKEVSINWSLNDMKIFPGD